MHAPTAIVPSADIARALVPLAAEPRRSSAAGWAAPGAEARQIFRRRHAVLRHARGGGARLRDAGHLPAQPGAADRGPAGAHRPQAGRPAAVRALVDAALASGREMLTEPEAKAVLQACGIPVVATRVVSPDPVDAARAAAAIGFPVVLKILSPQISHKSDVGGVALALDTKPTVRAPRGDAGTGCALLRPQAQVEGFTVQAMMRGRRRWS
jgi:acetyltransferase